MVFSKHLKKNSSVVMILSAKKTNKLPQRLNIRNIEMERSYFKRISSHRRKTSL